MQVSLTLVNPGAHGVSWPPGVNLLPPGPPPIPPPDPSLPSSAYYDALMARPDVWKANALRSQALIDSVSQVRPNVWVTYDPMLDAAKASIPPFSGFLPIASVGPDRITFQRALTSGEKNLMAKNRAFKVDDEILTVIPWSTFGQQFADSDTSVLVNRAQFGTAPAIHASGTPALLSQNNLLNQVRVPLGTSDGNTYFVTWDVLYGSSYIGTDLRATAVGHKEFQLAAGNNGIWLEIRTRADGIDGIGTVIGFDRSRYVGLIDGRYYADASATFAGLTSVGTIKPQTARFTVKPNIWTRFWWLIDQRQDDFDVCTLFVADELTDPITVFDGLRLNARANSAGVRTISHWYLEQNSSDDLYRGSLRLLESWTRNLVALRNTPSAQIPDLLIRPEAA